MTPIQKKKREYQTYKANMERKGCLPLSESQFRAWILKLINDTKEKDQFERWDAQEHLEGRA